MTNWVFFSVETFRKVTEIPKGLRNSERYEKKKFDKNQNLSELNITFQISETLRNFRNLSECVVKCPVVICAVPVKSIRGYFY